MGAAIDMIGRRYGKLTVVGRAENRNNIRYWRCHCDCGAEILTQGRPLRNGNKTSCGCDRRTKSPQAGERYGALTVLGRAGYGDSGRVLYRFLCDCGNTVTGTVDFIRRGAKIPSCGCQKMHRRRREQLCWQCRHGTNPENRCPWTAVDYERMQPRFEPVPGWTAERIKYNGAETYTIKACPLFERG